MIRRYRIIPVEYYSLAGLILVYYIFDVKFNLLIIR